MALIDWKEEFAIGVPSVDYEHRELIELINLLYGNLAGKQDRLEVSNFLGEIHTKISAHFALEEKLMRERQYDQYDDHKADHERLLDDIGDIIDSYEDSKQLDEQDLASRLNAWFTEHFRTKDARLHRLLT